jgi:hypothetical protein
MYGVGYEDISLWYDCWLEGGPLASCVPFVNIMDVDKQVEDIYGKITLGTLEIWQRQLIPLDLQYKIRVVPISWVFIMA